MVQKKFEIKISFIYQDIHIYLKYFNLICKIIIIKFIIKNDFSVYFFNPLRTDDKFVIFSELLKN